MEQFIDKSTARKGINDAIYVTAVVIHITSDRHAEKQTPLESLVLWTFDAREKESAFFVSINLKNILTAPDCTLQ